MGKRFPGRFALEVERVEAALAELRACHQNTQADARPTVPHHFTARAPDEILRFGFGRNIDGDLSFCALLDACVVRDLSWGMTCTGN